MKPSKAAMNGQVLTHVSIKSLESHIDREHPEGAFSDPSMGTQGMDRIQLARSPKDTRRVLLKDKRRNLRDVAEVLRIISKTYIPEGLIGRVIRATLLHSLQNPKAKLDFIVATEGPQFGS